MDVKNVSIDSIKPYDKNPRNNDDAVEAVANSIREFGWQQPIVVDAGGVIIAGHTRYKAAKKLKLKEVPIVVADNLSEEQVKAYRLADNKVGELAEWNDDLLQEQLNEILDIDMTDFGFNLDQEIEKEPRTPDALTNDFMVPPFSVLDTRQGNWQNRKKQWLDLGIKSELGREGDLTFAKSINVEGLSGTSVFDPVLTEIIYKWFIPYDRASIYDPFAGGSVRGIVAATLGHQYTGIDLRKEQIDANYKNAKEIGTDIDLINWYVDDSQNADKYVKDNSQDLIIACPPYLDLEVYSDNPKDLSTMPDDEFDKIYQNILQKAVKKLKNNRFAVIVVSDVRGKGKNSGYRDLSGMTKKAFIDSGCCFYNDIVLLNAIGSAAMRARRYMKSRKVARVHQNVLVFYKGDITKIKDEFNEIHGLNDAIKNIDLSN